MWPQRANCKLLCFLFALCVLVTDILGLRNVTLSIEPSVVKVGGNSTLRCTYDLEEDKLYSVKWYRGSHEFYRYDASELPNPIKQFPILYVTPDMANSNLTQVVLKDIEFNLAGNFSCEVTTDGPDIHTRIDSQSMSVVQIPEHQPQISVGREPLDYGDILRANCSSYPSRPPADLIGDKRFFSRVCLILLIRRGRSMAVPTPYSFRRDAENDSNAKRQKCDVRRRPINLMSQVLCCAPCIFCVYVHMIL